MKRVLLAALAACGAWAAYAEDIGVAYDANGDVTVAAGGEITVGPNGQRYGTVVSSPVAGLFHQWHGHVRRLRTGIRHRAVVQTQRDCHERNARRFRGSVYDLVRILRFEPCEELPVV